MALNKQQVILSVAMLALASGITTLLFLNRPTAQIAEPEYVPLTVDVTEVVKEDIRIPVLAQGTVSPLRQTSLIAEVSGRITEVSAGFNVGGHVEQGEVLLRIDPSDYQTALLRAQSALASAESALAQERGRADVALREWQKLPSGSQRSEEARDLYLRKPQLDQAEAEVLAARADLETATDNLERSIIRAPYPSLIRAKHVELGQFVSQGTPLAEVSSVDYAEVRLPIPRNRLAYLDLPGLGEYEDSVAIDLYTELNGEVTHWPASLHRSEGVFDERSRVLYAVARISDPYGLKQSRQAPLRIGSFITARIDGRKLEGLVALPRHILRADNHVWVVDEQLRLRDRQVSILRTSGDLVYVTAGLDNGEKVSLTAIDSSLSGAEVRVVSSVRSDQLRADGQYFTGAAEAPPAAAVN